MRRPRLRGVAAVGVGIALVVAAWGVMALEPDQEFAQRPIDVRVEVGERGVGRNVIATVHEVVIAEALTHEDEYNPWNGTTTGTWIVVFASVESVIDGGSLTATLEYADLIVAASPRPPIRYSLESRALEAGIAETGWLAFEVPADTPLAETATVRISDTIDFRLDTVIVVRLDLASAPRVTEFIMPVVETAVIR